MSYHLFVGGIPKGQPRVRFARRGRFVKTWTPDVADDWKAAIRAASLPAKPAEIITGPVFVRLVFWMPRPKDLMRPKYADEPPRPHKSKPDIDNLSKAVLDAMSEWWSDDCVVAMLAASKWYAPVNGPTGVDIHVHEMEHPSCH